MFDLPEAKRVRRTELDSPHSTPSGSRSPSPATNATIQARLAALYGPASPLPEPAKQSEVPKGLSGINEEQNGEEDEEYEFRLFARPKTSIPEVTASQTQDSSKVRQDDTNLPTARIRISSPPAAAGSGGFVNPHRPRSYYFTWEQDKRGIAHDERKAQFASIAVDGATIRQEGQKRWPGHFLPWRICLLPRSQFRNVPVYEHGPSFPVPSEEPVKKRKPNKKRRIILRQRAQKLRDAKAARDKSKEEKEREEAERKTRKNRAKNVKQKERKKRKKTEESAAAEAKTGSEGAEDVAMAGVQA